MHMAIEWMPFDWQSLRELLLLPNWVALDLVDCWWYTCNGEQVFQLLVGEIAHANGMSFA